MAWVCVSEEFHVFNISKAIFQAIGGGNQEFANLNLIQVALTEKLSNKRFLIVLDDVWSENYTEWELLQRPFLVGAHGSKIIVTTRKNTVALVMDSVITYHLELLSSDEALSLLCQHALDKQNFDSQPTFKTYGEGIMMKCNGLPLALKTIGRALRTKTNEEEWAELLDSEIWNLHNEIKILPALRLSYYDLPPHLKIMFAYCCLFPKDYAFHKDELVLLWIAEGFLYEPLGSKSMEKLGHKCFNELVSRSLFQPSNNDRSRYTMHDLVHDLATSVAGEFFSTLGDKMDLDLKNGAFEKLRHFSFIRRKYNLYKKFKTLEKAKRLRTFLAVSTTNGNYYISNKIHIELVPRLTLLRVLSFAKFNITEVPKSIGDLKHLRYLNFSNTSITCLPERISNLYNLQSLLVSGCRKLYSLPHSFVNLINLRHLDISDTPKLKEMPVGIGGLTGLQTLSKVIIGGASEFKLSDLKDLVHLEGKLSIKGLRKVTNATHAKEANLDKKKGLLDLELDWSGDVFDDTMNERLEYEVLEGLRPDYKLRSLEILYYRGKKFPSWVGDSSFVGLTELILRGCQRCTCSPTLGELPLLQKLFLESMNELKKLLEPANSCFRALEVLGLKNMEGWEEWSIDGADNDRTIVSFPCVREISIVNCPKLNVVAIGLIPSLRVLHIDGCSVSILRSIVSVSSSIFMLKVGNIKGLTFLHRELLDHLTELEYLSISRCDELAYLWGSEAEAYDNLGSLQKLEVNGCVNLVSLAETKANSTISMRSIREVVIMDCPKLESYDCPDSIEKLEIYECGLITNLTFPPVHNTLKFLMLEYCDNLQMNWVFSNFLSSLGSLEIRNISNMKLFPAGCLIHLTELSISGCDEIESIPGNGYGFLPCLCLRTLRIISCKNLKLFPHEHFKTLTSLEEIWISSCPSLDDAFPCGLWPPNLSWLYIGGLKKPISKWGVQHFPMTLVTLMLNGEKSRVVTFGAKTEEETGRYNGNNNTSLLLPSSLTRLHLNHFDELEQVAKGMEHLRCLEQLEIYNCPKLKDLPETLLPSLSCLKVIPLSGN